MSDKSFGDQTNRNIVKNPLLSTAVTSLCLEDLTHNAVLLPVAHNQELISRQDQPGPENAPLAHAASPTDSNASLNTQTFPNNAKSEPKTEAKDDDFDVNEYFARLQGTRYVSAPLNSSLKEPAPADENLEEINLNEPEVVEPQQSLRADIAQNFSQLPTVLPQVASAVFSSFSNMLYKREVTPEASGVKVQETQGVQRNLGGSEGVMLMGVEEPSVAREVAPPPREPAVGGTTNFRMTSKKMAYAHIPGLSSQAPPQNIPTQQPFQMPPTNTPTNYYTLDSSTIVQHPSTDVKQDAVEIKTQPPTEYNIFNPIEAQDNTPLQAQTNIQPTFYNVPANETKEPQPAPIAPPSAQGSIIPPPPMFSNLPKNEATAVGKSVLPPSVARRIGANHPFLKPQPGQPPSFPASNIFIPAAIPDTEIQNTTIPAVPSNTSIEATKLEASAPDQAPTNMPSAFVQFKPPQQMPPVNKPQDETLTDSTPPKIPPIGVPPIGVAPMSLPPSSARPNLGPGAKSPIQMPIQPPFFNPADIASSLSVMNAPRRQSVESAVAENTAYLNKTVLPRLHGHQPIDLHPDNHVCGGSRNASTFFNPEHQGAPINAPNFNKNLIPTNPVPNLPKPDPIVSPYSVVNQQFEQPTEAAKPIPEPPKLTGGLNYRMTKKRPQYYSGPIEGVGAISNNVKPVIPDLEPNAFVGAMFTPNQTTDQAISDQTPAPFDISQPAELTSSYTPFAINSQINNQAQSYVPQDHSTAFDLSRASTDNFNPLTYEPPKEQSSGFGIIGSLKSKLSSIDINKIQNSVTTFFDPAYNDTKKEPTDNQGNIGNVGTGFANQESNLEIFVPDPNQNQQSFNSQNQYHNIYSTSQDMRHGGTQDIRNSSDELPRRPPGHGHYPKSYHHHAPQIPHHHHFDQMHPNFYPEPRHHHHPVYYQHLPAEVAPIQSQEPIVNPQPTIVPTDIPAARQAFEEVQRDTQNNNEANLLKNLEKPEKKITSLTGAPGFIDSKYNTYNLFGIVDNSTPADDDNNELPDASLETDTRSYFDNLSYVPTQQAKPDNTIDKMVNLQAKEAPKPIQEYKEVTPALQIIQPLDFGVDLIPPSLQSSLTSASDFFGLSTIDNKGLGFIQSPFGCAFVKNEEEDVDDIPEDLEKVVDETIGLVLNEDPKEDIPIVDVSTVPLFGLSNILAEKTKEIADLEDNMKNVTLKQDKNNKSRLDSDVSVGLMDNLNTSAQPLTDEENEGIVSNLSICETCREIDKPEENDVDDLTVKLIENITSPIQLSNPVTAVLTETNTPVDDETTDFGTKQCADITHITEETIETIQAQSAIELLDPVEEIKDTTEQYGWTTKNNAFLNSESIVDNKFTFQADPNAIGFFGNNTMFFDNIPKNASDEIKAEFKSSQEDSPVILPRQLSLPTAPPAEDDDTKSDETGGLDVLSIEQDAKKDFPIFEEFVIEPSETDDDKIEFREREKSADDTVQEVDSFTNRVERFKKMEEVEKHDDVFEAPKPGFGSAIPTSPGLPIASYFDTGNYAVESHYRNSLTSPEIPMRIPPGFEEEYKRRLSGIAQNVAEKDSDTDVAVPPTIPDTSTQTPVVSTATYSNVSNLSTSVTTSVALPKEETTDAMLPVLASGDSLASSIFGGLEEKKETTTPPLVATVPKTEQSTLPDPISFFSGQESNTEPDAGFNRLASYFQTPAKTDHGKSFFELSQSQNHYRHASAIEDVNSNHVAPIVNNIIDKNANINRIQNIPADAYVTNMQLMKDLTSVQNLAFPKDQIVRTVNYFTVEYDNDEIKPRNSDVKTLDETPKETNPNNNNDKLSNEDDILMNIVKKCRYCRNVESRNVVTLNKVELNSVKYKYKKAMDNDTSENNKDSGGGGAEERKDDRRREVSVSFGSLDEENEGVAMVTENRGTAEYTPVKHHWFYRVDFEGKSIWRGFSASDNRALEEAFHSPDLTEDTLVATDGGRFDVNVVGRLRVAVYWADKPTNVRRCSWFYKGATDARYVPYTEPVAEKLEEEYRHGITTGEWHRRLTLPHSESVVMHGPGVMVHFPQAAADAFGSSPQSTMRPRVVRRGNDETEIEDTEPSSIDHLLLLCHGVGSACDMRFRSVEEVVDDFRATSLQLLQSHYRNSYDKGVVNRVEVLPISWHATLHSGETGVDKRLAAITLDSIPKLRNFTNDTVLDVLFYTSPVFCQTIIDTVCAELNRIYSLFTRRNPQFAGRVSLGGHSLGSVILYDLLCHQMKTESPTAGCKDFVSGSAGSGQPCVVYPALAFQPAALYALGSPIAMFECIRGVKSLGADFSLPTCKNFFNIFHPYDPIAYRIEPLINSALGDVKPFLIPHHKGRKRMHLELKDTMARVGADLKQKLLESLKATWTSMWKSQPPPSDHQLEKVVEEEIEKEQLCEDKEEDPQSNEVAAPVSAGRLNDGRRVDYVLQEAPFEMINEYLFAMSSHVCYWESEDTMLLMLREIYSARGVQPDGSLPQHTMTVQRRRPEDNETIVLNAAEHPSTSRGGT